MTEQERIKSIKNNGGFHLNHFKPENITYNICLAAVQSTGEAIHIVPEQFRTEEMYQEACKQDGMIITSVPEKFLTKEIYEYSAKSDGAALQYVPEEYRSKELCKKAAISSTQAYSYIPTEFITPEFVAEVAQKSSYETIRSLPAALKKNTFYYELICVDPQFIWYIPQKALTAKNCKTAIAKMGYSSTSEAIKDNPELLSRLHYSLYDHDTCLNFVNSDFFKKSTYSEEKTTNRWGFNTQEDAAAGRFYMGAKYHITYSLPHLMQWPDVAIPFLKLNGAYLEFCTPDNITEGMCKLAISSYAYAVKFLPEKFKTREMFTLAFEKAPSTIEYLPEKLKSREMYMLAFENSPNTIKYFPEEYLTNDLVVKAVEYSPYALGYIPVRFRTKDACLIALSHENTYGIFNFVPSSIKDKDICMAWLNNINYEHRPLDKIPSEIWDYDIFLASVSVDGNELYRVPSDILDEAMCLAAVKRTPEAAKFIPKELFTQEMAYAMLERNGSNINRTAADFELIPPELLNEEICIKAINIDWKIFEKIPDELKSLDMCNVAFHNAIGAFKYFPEKYVTYDLLVYISRNYPYLLNYNFPQKFRTSEIIEKLIAEAPNAEANLRSLLK